VRAAERRKAAKAAVTQEVPKLTKKGLLEESSRNLLAKADAQELEAGARIRRHAHAARARFQRRRAAQRARSV